jgi:hypothetical protein
MQETWNKYAPTAARSLSASARRPRAETIDVHSHMVVAAVLSLDEANMAAFSGGNARRLLSLS